MHRLAMFAVATASAVLIASPAPAQGRGRGNAGVPPGQRPPAGMCRIWIDGVPPGQQPAPTDCATAAATRPANARIIYSDRNGDRHDDRTLPNRRIYTSNGNVVILNGQRCVQRTDPTGQLRTFCANSDRDDDDHQLAARIDGDQNRMLNGRLKKSKKHHEKDHHDRDHDDRS